MKVMKKYKKIYIALIISFFLPMPFVAISCSRGIKYNSVPVTSDYFSFAEDGSILGWSERVLDDFSLLDGFDALSLKERVINGECRFLGVPADERNNSFNFTYIDLSYTNWKMDDSYYTGYQTFSNTSFPSLVELNLMGANFVDTSTFGVVGSDSSTAKSTFSWCLFPNLKSINFKNTKFATPNMINGGELKTADSTFRNCSFSKITTLDLSNAIFACSNMATAGNVYTAAYTFFDIEFLVLDEIKWGKTVFADVQMGGNQTQIATATFGHSHLSGLEELNLSDLALSDSYAFGYECFCAQ